MDEEEDGVSCWSLVSRDLICPLDPTLMTFMGREDECDLTIKSRHVDKKHAAITYEEACGLFKIKDLGSLNGTFVNDSRISGDDYIHLHHGDSVRLAYDAPTFRLQSASRSPLKWLDESAVPCEQHTSLEEETLYSRPANILHRNSEIMLVSSKDMPIPTLSKSLSLDDARALKHAASDTNEQFKSVHYGSSTWEKADRSQVMAECQGCIDEQHIQHICDTSHGSESDAQRRITDTDDPEETLSGNDIHLQSGSPLAQSPTTISPLTNDSLSGRRTGTSSTSSPTSPTPYRYSPIRHRSESPLFEKWPLSPLRSPLFERELNCPPAAVEEESVPTFIVDSAAIYGEDFVDPRGDNSECRGFTAECVSPICFKKPNDSARVSVSLPMISLAKPSKATKSASQSGMSGGDKSAGTKSHGTPLYGQPDWWGEDSVNGEEYAADRPGKKDDTNTANQNNSKVVDSPVDCSTHTAHNGNTEHPQNVLSESPAKVAEPSTAFTIDLETSTDDHTSPQKVNIGGSLSNFLPPHIRRSIEKKAAAAAERSSPQHGSRSPGGAGRKDTKEGRSPVAWRSRKEGKAAQEESSAKRNSVGVSDRKSQPARTSVPGKPPSGRTAGGPPTSSPTAPVLHVSTIIKQSPLLNAENVGKASDGSPVEANYLINRMLAGAIVPSSSQTANSDDEDNNDEDEDDDEDDEATESSMYAEAAIHRRLLMRKSRTMPDIGESTASSVGTFTSPMTTPMTPMTSVPDIPFSQASPQKSGAFSRNDKEDKMSDIVSEAGTYTIDCDSTDLKEQAATHEDVPERDIPLDTDLDSCHSEDSLERGNALGEAELLSCSMNVEVDDSGLRQSLSTTTEELNSGDVSLRDALLDRESSFDNIFFAKQKQSGAKGPLQTLPDTIAFPEGRQSTEQDHSYSPALGDTDMPVRRSRRDVDISKDEILQGLGIGDLPSAEADKNRPQLMEELLSSRKHHKDDDPIIVNKTDFFNKIKQGDKKDSTPSSPSHKLNASMDSSVSGKPPRRQASANDDRSPADQSYRSPPPIKRKNSAESISTDVLLKNTEAFISSMTPDQKTGSKPPKGNKPPVRQSTATSRGTRLNAESTPVTGSRPAYSKLEVEAEKARSSKVDEFFSGLSEPTTRMTSSLTVQASPREAPGKPKSSVLKSHSRDVMTKSYTAGDSNNNGMTGSRSRNGSGNITNLSSSQRSYSGTSRMSRPSTGGSQNNSRSNSVERRNSINSRDQVSSSSSLPRRQNSMRGRSTLEKVASPGLDRSGVAVGRSTGGVSGRKVGSSAGSSGAASSARSNRTFELKRARTEGEKAPPSSARSSATSSVSSSSVSNPSTLRRSRALSTERSEVSLGARIVAKSRENTGSSSSSSSFKRNDGGRHSLRVTGTSAGVTGSGRSSAAGGGKTASSSGGKKNSAAEVTRVAEKKAWQRRQSYDPRRAVAEAKAKSRPRAEPNADQQSQTGSYERYDDGDSSFVLNSGRNRGGELDAAHSDEKELEIAMFSSELAKDLELLSRGDEELLLGSSLDAGTTGQEASGKTGRKGDDTDCGIELHSPLQLVDERPISKDHVTNAFAPAAALRSTGLSDNQHHHDSGVLGAVGTRRLRKNSYSLDDGIIIKGGKNTQATGSGDAHLKTDVRSPASAVSASSSTEVAETMTREELSVRADNYENQSMAGARGAPVHPLTLHAGVSPLGNSEGLTSAVFHKSAFSSFSDQSLSPPNSPALSPVRAKVSQSRLSDGHSSSASPKTPGGASDQSYNSVILSSIHQLSTKLKLSTSKTVSKLSTTSPVLGDTPSPTEDILTQESSFPANQELADILRTLRVVNHNVTVMERHMFQRSDSKSNITDCSSVIGPHDDQGEYLAEISRLRNEITGFKPIDQLNLSGGAAVPGGGRAPAGRAPVSSGKGGTTSTKKSTASGMPRAGGRGVGASGAGAGGTSSGAYPVHTRKTYY